MLAKRIIGAVVVKDDLVVQSFGYKSYLPIGKPEYIIENLDRWGVDEIIILNIDRSLRNLGPNLKLIKYGLLMMKIYLKKKRSTT